ncbi:hypothetical protein B0H10DRAFT_1949532 [Mycena sp. CBHHK59/15]|nr:hypothetical protein B0H10DRAFT_1949532 [Mycena sp. CBHHK59/15]
MCLSSRSMSHSGPKKLALAKPQGPDLRIISYSKTASCRAAKNPSRLSPHTSYKDANGEVPNLEKILKDKDCHSWDGTPGERQTNRAPMVNGQLFAALGQLGQGSIIQDKAICYVNTVRAMKCTGKDSAGGACTGYQVLKEAVKASTTSSTRVSHPERGYFRSPGVWEAFGDESEKNKMSNDPKNNA